MEVLHYPLLCWSLGKENVCGHLVGTEIELVASTPKKIKTMLTKQLERDFHRDPNVHLPPISKPQVSTFPVAVRPGYREKHGTFPSTTELNVPVTAVFGENDFGYFTCFIPMLREQFYYYKPGEVKSLVEHFSRDRFRGWTPEKVHRLLLPDDPWLDLVSVKVKGRRQRSRTATVGRPDLPMLESVADRHPYPRAVRRKMSVYPTVAWERGGLVRLVQDKLQKENANLLLVGDPGVGKSAILMEAVRQLHSSSGGRNAPHFWRTSPRRMIAGARWLGEWQEIIERIMEEVDHSRDVLWLVDFVELLRTGDEGAEASAAAFMMPHLDRENVRVIGEVTPRQLEAARTMLPGFVDRFQVVPVEEMTRVDMLRVLDHFRKHAKQTVEIEMERAGLETAYRLLKRYMRYERFPGKAIRFLGERLNDAYLDRRKRITEKRIIKAFTEKTGLPELFLRDDLPLKPGELDAFFTQRIIGQESAVRQVGSLVKVFKAGLNDPDKPVGTMLFAGPTGVGKTATARALAEYVFGVGQKLDPLLRLDMSEFQHPGQIDRLIGSTRGEPGRLLQHLRDRPFSVVLLDEIEKAHPVFFDAFLGVMDEGMLVDAYGRVTDFRNTVIIMTTNLGTKRGGSLGFREGDEPERFEADIRSFFRPEFYNRIDHVVTFDPLGEEVILGITRKELAELPEREGFRKRGLKLKFSEELVLHLAKVGFDPIYGARPLQRAVERQVVGPLARHLLENPSLAKATLKVGFKNGEIRIG